MTISGLIRMNHSDACRVVGFLLFPKLFGEDLISSQSATLGSFFLYVLVFRMDCALKAVVLPLLSSVMRL